SLSCSPSLSGCPISKSVFFISALGSLSGGDFGVEFAGSFAGNGDCGPLAGLGGEMFCKESDLAQVVGVVGHLAVDRLHHGVRFGTASYGVGHICFAQRLQRVNTYFQPLSQSSINSARVLGGPSNSVSRLRS